MADALTNHDRLIAFLRNPPKRISAEAIKKRKKRKGQILGSRKGRLFKRQKGRCKYCSVPMTWDICLTGVTVDHVVPLSKGGKNQLDNIVLACRRCNQAKASMAADEFKSVLAAGLENRPARAGTSLKRGWR